MQNVFYAVLLAIIGVHGYFWLSYGTLHPCDAALKRMQEEARAADRQGDAAVAWLFDTLGGEALLRDQVGMTGCYELALTGNTEFTSRVGSN